MDSEARISIGDERKLLMDDDHHSEKPEAKAPANGILTKEEKVIDASVLHGNVYKGPPRSELDKAWQELLFHANIRVSGEELAKSGGNSVPLGDGSGYYGILDVFHQLHCLKYVRHFIFQDYYNDTMPWTPTHVDHCIDSIRQNLMCNADLSLMTFHWVDDDMAPKPLFRRTHECANWENIQEWASKRSFNPDDPNLLLHPKLAKN
ncbi:uncharacterized protein PGRI_094590 [Penicillium griseofulvum]|uniref:Tat pathway signal sequence n=1 Tax=Penicillium patulum TaxID=5078 RepID=A0A135LR36_PENPA|nr:uncharacterized protein PGRI_094590 [Penicillium griseofulvum]KXG51447.1 hypothetical protein PGRI_094590 [Penicillium griseofulvum]